MSITEITVETIFDYHLQAARLLQNMRHSLSSEYSNVVNIQMIIASACYIEGYLENTCRRLLMKYTTGRSRLEIDYPDEETRIRLINFYQRLENDFDTRLSRATGIEHYGPLIEILMGKKLSSDDLMKAHCEGITILFTLRNMFAHGRLFEKRILVSAPKMPAQDERTKLLSGYERVANYLMKQKLIHDNKSCITLSDITSNIVADHFLNLAENFCSEIPEFQERALYIPSTEEWLEDFLSEVRDKYNKKHNTNFSAMDLIRKGVILIQTEDSYKDKQDLREREVEQNYSIHAEMNEYA